MSLRGCQKISKRIVILLILVINVFLYGCVSNNGTTIIKDVPVASITPVFSDTIPSCAITIDNLCGDFFNDEIRAIKIIPLETTDSCLIGKITHLAMFNDTIVVCDASKAQKVFLYDSTGKFLRTIGSKGSGPAEYSAISQFTADANGVYIYDWLTSKYLHYDYDGKLVREQAFYNTCPQQVYQLDDTLFVATYSAYSEVHPYSLTWIDVSSGEDKECGTALPFEFSRNWVYGEIKKTLNGEIQFFKSGYETVYRIDNKTLSPLFSLGFGDLDEFYQQHDRLTEKDFRIKLYRGKPDESPVNFYYIYECGEKLITHFQKGFNSYISVTDLKNMISHTYLRSNMEDETMPIPFIFYDYNQESILSWIDTENISFVKSIIEGQKGIYPIECIRDFIDKYNEEDNNPAVCVLTLK